ncbi:MAG: alcohol dehydrogenase catalytic domain-containing protein [Acidobacteria bacterium]|nr:alcohol dehydrogenase catalytic domain-containing protein [Acidobacteriota bacterium]MCI0568585.1 alcohol dehydrogenase catalytic domain-containing protein [Acidobacteriota bacterium]
MKAAVYYGNRDVRLEERPSPSPAEGELLLRVEASGICGSDVMEWYRIRKAPLVLGHEVAGTVAQVGTAVRGYRPGERVVATHHVPCNTCRYCLTDRHSVCDTLRTSHFDPGGFAELIRLPALNVDRGTFKLPDHVSCEEGSFVEPLACVVRAQRMAGVSPGQSVAVLGSGISGILHIQLARAIGAGKIFATDLQEARLKMARKFGADLAISSADDVPAKIRSANEGRLAEQVLVCTAALPAIRQAFASVDRGGTILFFAPVAPGAKVEFPMHEMWNDAIRVVHSYAGPPADMLAALDLIASRRVDVASMVTHRLPLSRAQEGFNLVLQAADSLKVILDPRL